MSDSAKELKLAAARSKLNQYRNRRGRGKEGSATLTASAGGGGSQTSTALSSRASSCEPLNEFPDHHVPDHSMAANASHALSYATNGQEETAGSLITSDSFTNPGAERNCNLVSNISTSTSNCESVSSYHVSSNLNGNGDPNVRTMASFFHTAENTSVNPASKFFEDSVLYAQGNSVPPSQFSVEYNPTVNSEGTRSQEAVVSAATSLQPGDAYNVTDRKYFTSYGENDKQNLQYGNELSQSFQTTGYLNSNLGTGDASQTNPSVNQEMFCSVAHSSNCGVVPHQDTISNTSNHNGYSPTSVLDYTSQASVLERDSSVESDQTSATAFNQALSYDADGHHGGQDGVSLLSSGDQGTEGRQMTREQYISSRSSGENTDRILEANTSVQNLRQISTQLQGLMSEAQTGGDILPASDTQPSNNIGQDNTANGRSHISSSSELMLANLQAQNSALVQQLQQQQLLTAQQQQQLQQLTAMLQEARSTNNSNNNVIPESNTPSGGEEASAEEVVRLRQQLHIHVQTVGILVAEKTQLEAQVHELQQGATINVDLAREMEGRLAASRRRVQELEAAVQAGDGSSSALKGEADRLRGLMETLQEERDRYKLRCTDHELRAAELAERVNSSGRDQLTLQTQLTETKTQLHMANIRIEQLRNSSGDSANILDELNQEKRGHQVTQDQLCQSRLQLAQAEADKTQLVAQYQLYTNQLTQQQVQLEAQVADSQQQTQHRDALLQEKQQQLEQLQQQMQQMQVSADGVSNAQQQIQQQYQQLQQLSADHEQLKVQFKEAQDINQHLEQDNLSLSHLSEEQRQKLEELELSLDKRQTEAVDSGSLLARLQSDKVAASRALAQNKQLKEQLAELQDGFVMMSNKKLELTEKLERELHQKKTLLKEVSDATEEARQLRDAGSVREREVQQLRESCSCLASQLAAIKQKNREQQQLQMEQQQLALAAAAGQQTSLSSLENRQDTLQRKAESQSSSSSQFKHENESQANNPELNSVHSEDCKPSTLLSQEGASVHVLSDVTSSESSPLLQTSPGVQTASSESGDSTVLTSDDGSNTASSNSGDTGCSSLESKQSEARAEQEALIEFSLVKEDSQNSYPYILAEGEAFIESTSVVDILAKLESQGAPTGRCALLEYRLAQLSSTHSALVTRFQRAMNQVAELSEERQRLEVLMEQLQLENETIGDYITLYQFRRGVLSQQLREKDLQLDRLRGDRQTLVDNLAKLQELMVRLGKEQGGDEPAGGLLAAIANLLAPPPPAEATTATTAAAAAPTNGAESQNSPLEKTSLAASLKDEAAPTPGGSSSRTVTRILELIKEMEQPINEGCSLQPCGLCSGSLITV